MPKKKLFIFDMDGLMFDTERLVYECYLETAKVHGFEMQPLVFKHVIGKTHPDIIKTLQTIYQEDEAILNWRKDIAELKYQLIEERGTVRKKLGLIEILDFAKHHDAKIAVASSSKREVIDWYLDLEGIEAYFDVKVAGDEVRRGKPDPEVFLTACHKAGIHPSHAIVMEDSPAGVKAANRAGITSFHVKDDLSDLPSYGGRIKIAPDLSTLYLPPIQADYSVNNLLEVRDIMQNNGRVF